MIWVDDGRSGWDAHPHAGDLGRTREWALSVSLLMAACVFDYRFILYLHFTNLVLVVPPAISIDVIDLAYTVYLGAHTYRVQYMDHIAHRRCTLASRGQR